MKEFSMPEIFNAVIEGQEVVFTILKVFSDDLNNRDFILYTDHTMDADGNFNVYLSLYNAFEKDPFLEELKSASDWKTAEKFLNKEPISIESMLKNPEKAVSEIINKDRDTNCLLIEKKLFRVLAGFLDESGKKEYFLAAQQDQNWEEIVLVEVLSKDVNNSPTGFSIVKTNQCSEYVQNKTKLLLRQLKSTE